MNEQGNKYFDIVQFFIVPGEHLTLSNGDKIPANRLAETDIDFRILVQHHRSLYSTGELPKKLDEMMSVLNNIFPGTEGRNDDYEKLANTINNFRQFISYDTESTNNNKKRDLKAIAIACLRMGLKIYDSETHSQSQKIKILFKEIGSWHGFYQDSRGAEELEEYLIKNYRTEARQQKIVDQVREILKDEQRALLSFNKEVEKFKEINID